MARTYRNHPSFVSTRRYCGDCGSATCDWCLNNRTLATRKVRQAAADEMRNDYVCHVDAELRAEWEQEAAMPTFASVDLIRRYEEEEADYWDAVDSFYADMKMGPYDEMEEDWAKEQEIEWAYEQRDRELAAWVDDMTDWAAFEMERGNAWD
jgi:hypothetical protein